jgi:hypothetical protein
MFKYLSSIKDDLFSCIVERVAKVEILDRIIFINQYIPALTPPAIPIK